MKNPTTVREARAEDINSIIAFQKAMAWETEKMKLNEETLSSGVKALFSDRSKGKYYVATIEKKVVASLMITFEWSDWRNREIWWFQSVYIAPEHRRKGVFSSMYNFIKKEAALKGVPGLRLYVESGNLNAQKTYESLGMDSSHYKMYEWLRD